MMIIVQKNIQLIKKTFKENPLYLVVFIFLFTSLILGGLLLQNSALTKTFTSNTRASDSVNLQTLTKKYNSRVPEGPDLIPINQRFDLAKMSSSERENASKKVYFIANYPSNSGHHDAWNDPRTQKVIAQRAWTGIYEIFPWSDFDEIINSNLSKDQAVAAILERQKALEKFMSRYYGYILNDTLFSKYRIEITEFPEEVHHTNEINKKLKEKYGITTDVIRQNGQLIGAQVLAKAGYNQIDILIDRNIQGSTIQTDISNEHFKLYQGLTDEGVGKMAEQIRRINSIVKEANGTVNLRFIYMNEIDILNCHYKNCIGSSVYYFQYPVTNPKTYAESYYKLAKQLSNNGITLVPSTFALGFPTLSSFFTDQSGLNPWIAAMAELKNQYSLPYDYLASNMYGTTDEIKARVAKINSQVQLANQRYGTNLSFVRVQEFGMLPHQPNNNDYYGNLPKRIAELKTQLEFFRDWDAGVYAQTALNLAPWDGEVPDEVLRGHSNFNHGFIYRDEPAFWNDMRNNLNKSITANAYPVENRPTAGPNATAVPAQPQQSGPNSVPSQSGNNDLCPGVSAGVTNTCGNQPWRGCYCDTNLNMYVNSCGEAGEEEFKVTAIGCNTQAAPQRTNTTNQQSAPAQNTAGGTAISCYTNEYCGSIGAGDCINGACGKGIAGTCQKKVGEAGVAPNASNEVVPNQYCPASRFNGGKGGSAPSNSTNTGSNVNTNSNTNTNNIQQNAAPATNTGGGNCPAGKSCPNPIQTCTQESCGGNVGNCASCPNGYKWCYGGYCVKN